MARALLIVTLLMARLCVNSQQLAQVAFSDATTLISFGFLTNDNVVIKISGDGNIVEYGQLLETYRTGYRPGALQPYNGRVDYYGVEADSILNGKIKSIGITFFTYYGSYEIEEKRGKLRTIGTALLDYYNNFENQSLRGKLKNAGRTELQYYSNFDNEIFRGKLKMVGNTPITWYSNFEQKFKQGKIKSIGTLNYTWTDERGFQGTYMQTPMAPVINGVMYIVM
jgi:hypothetical protein